MTGAGVLLAVVLGAGKVPIPDAVSRFPDPKSYVGVGVGQEANMLAAALGSGGQQMLWVGPGPQQLAARWFSGKLNSAERVAVLLGGAAFHDPTMLPVYAAALESPDLRQRQAALVGFFVLVGEAPPLPSAMRDDPAEWRSWRRAIRTLSWAARRRPLVRIWASSFLAAKGVRREEEFTFRRNPAACLRAIREIAEPADLPDLLALWPCLETQSERLNVMRTIEMITLQRFLDRPLEEMRPWGEWQDRAALAMVDSWVNSACRPIDGEDIVAASLARNQLLDSAGRATALTWLQVLKMRYPRIWPLAAERLTAYGAPAVGIDRHAVGDTVSNAELDRLRAYFPILANRPDVGRAR